MAIHLALRASPAGTWASVNPVLAQGELGLTTDTYIFKIGDGATNWNSLPIAPTGTPTQTIPWQSLGDGSDGNVTISSGTTTLARDMYYNNLVINGTGQIYTNGYKIFVLGVLDVTAAPVAAISFNGTNGSNATGSTAGAGATSVPAVTVGGTQAGGVGATGVTGVGVAGTSGTVAGTSNGGNSNITGLGGIGGSGAGGAASGGGAGTAFVFLRRYETNLIRGITILYGGAGGRGGSSGAGDGTNAGAGGGGGGAGAGVIAIYANVILKSSATPAGCIQANGGNGGNGGTATVGVTGGGSGGGGGGGGWVYICYNYIAGPTISGFIQANGGNGGNGGNGFGSAANVISGAAGSSGGYGGRITTFNIVSQVGDETFGQTNTEEAPQVTTGTAALFSVGGAGGMGGMRTKNL